LGRRGTAIAALVLALLLPRAARPQAEPQHGPPDPRLEPLEAAVTAYMTEQGIPGMSVGLVLDGRVVWTRGFGLADVENELAASELTMYRYASVSKPITAVAVMQLSERGQLDIDAPIQKYVPSFPTKAWRLTARQLLGHIGGIRAYAGDEFANMRHYSSLQEGLEIFRREPLVFRPGTRFLYSTYGYTLLGCAVEAASGQRFVDYLQARVFAPAEMETARRDDPLDLISHRARGYRRAGPKPTGELRNSPFADTSYKVPGGGLVGSVVDLVRFALALEGGTLVRPHTFEEMLTPQKTLDGKSTGYGFGFSIGEQDGVREAWHSGSQQQVSNFLYLQPERRLGVVFLSNLEEVAKRLELARQIAALAAPFRVSPHGTIGSSALPSAPLPPRPAIPARVLAPHQKN
jgi:CubicO group peptidase (beta-lactamase class C family)